MNHQPPFKASEDFVYDKDGHKVCMCWGRQGNPRGGNQEADTIAKALNIYHKLKIVMDNYHFDIKNDGDLSFEKSRTFEVALLRVALKTFPNDH